MRIVVLLLVLGMLLVPSAAASTSAASTQLYIATWGNDSWPGTVARPFATIGRAQQRVRAMTPRMTSDIVVNLRAGTHVLTAPLRLSTAAGDSGANGHRVIYQAHGAERVVLSGGRRITSWRPAGQPGVWRADIGGLRTRQLFVNGQRAVRAAPRTGLPGELTRTATGYHTTSTAPQAWQRPQDIELVYTGAYPWAEARCGVADIAGDAAGTTITMDQPCFDWANRIYYQTPDGTRSLPDPTAVENSASFLAEPGSWYLDRSRSGRHVLYYRGEDPRRADVVAPVLEALVAAGPLHDVTFRGITFAHNTWLAPDEPTGFAHIYGSEYYNGGPVPPDEDPTKEDSLTVPAAVSFRAAERIALEGNTFIRLGSQALTLSGSSSANVVRGNVFDDVSGGGILIGVLAPDTAGENRGNRIENNWIRRIGADYHGSAAINLEQTLDTTVSHNQVNDVPYSGIVVNNTMFGDARAGLRRHHILDNLVFGTNQVVPDGGGIYTFGTQGASFASGTLIRGNVVHDVTYPAIPKEFAFPNGFYIDEGDSVTVQSNVVYRGNHAYGFGFLTPSDILVHGNFWDDPEPGWWPPGAPLPDSVLIVGNTRLPPGDPDAVCRANPECADILASAGLAPAYRQLLERG